MAAINVTSYLLGRSVPVEVEVSFSLSAHGWAEFQESGEYDRLVGIVEDLEEPKAPLIHLGPAGRAETGSSNHNFFQPLSRAFSCARRSLAEAVRRRTDDRRG